MKKIILCGGGTAGHVYPALAVVEQLNDFEIHFFGGNGMEKDILSKFPNITYHEIPTVKLERRLTLKNFLIPFKLIKAIKTARKEIQKVSPDIIFSKGGFVSVPVVIGAKKLNIPVVSHESDLTFGLANKIILHYCKYMCTTFEPTGKTNKKCIHTGQPIRGKIFEGKPLRLPLNTNRQTLLVLGGSLGARFLNNIIFDNLDAILKKYNVIHICGKKNAQSISKENYILVPFAENIEDYYASADIVISRAGSGVINELLALSKPMLLIPLSKDCSRGDQIENAKLFEELGYSLTLQEEECDFVKLMNKLEDLSKNKQKFIKNMKKTAKNDAVFKICHLINKTLKEEQ